MKIVIKYGFFLTLFGFLVFQLESCKVSEDYERQEMLGPIEYTQDFPKDSSMSNLPWWQLFNDSILVDLIDTALVNNKNIQIAYHYLWIKSCQVNEHISYFSLLYIDFVDG